MFIWYQSHYNKNNQQGVMCKASISTVPYWLVNQSIGHPSVFAQNRVNLLNDTKLGLTKLKARRFSQGKSRTHKSQQHTKNPITSPRNLASRQLPGAKLVGRDKCCILELIYDILNTKKLPRLAPFAGGYEICQTNFTSN